jgi:hypothetical protein
LLKFANYGEKRLSVLNGGRIKVQCAVGDISKSQRRQIRKEMVGVASENRGIKAKKRNPIKIDSLGGIHPSSTTTEGRNKKPTTKKKGPQTYS